MTQLLGYGPLSEKAQRKENLAKCPTPYFQIAGMAVLVYKDPSEDQYGLLVLPDGKKLESIIGTIIQVGGGYATDWEYKPDDFRANCPYKPGDRVLWSKYDATTYKFRVHREWWTEEEIENMRQLKREEKVEFLILPMPRIVGLVTAPEKPIYED